MRFVAKYGPLKGALVEGPGDAVVVPSPASVESSAPTS